MLVYDLEIVRAIQGKGEKRIEGIDYCKGWDDHANMGISVIGVYDFGNDRYRVFCRDNLNDFRELVKTSSCFVSFNGIGFDNRLLAAEGIIIPEELCYDILKEVWIGDELGGTFSYPSHTGYGLDAICKANFRETKTGNGAKAPIDWQQGKMGSVIDYCLHDVKLTKDLYRHIQKYGEITSPKGEGKKIKVRRLGE